MKIKPLGRTVLVRIDRAPEKTKGGILIPTSAHEKQQLAAETGIVLAIGSDAHFGTLFPSPGDRVAFPRYSGKKVDELLFLMDDEDILAILEDDDAEKAA